jgi:hypothetical protein
MLRRARLVSVSGCCGLLMLLRWHAVSVTLCLLVSLSIKMNVLRSTVPLRSLSSPWASGQLQTLLFILLVSQFHKLLCHHCTGAALTLAAAVGLLLVARRCAQLCNACWFLLRQPLRFV